MREKKKPKVQKNKQVTKQVPSGGQKKDSQQKVQPKKGKK